MGRKNSIGTYGFLEEKNIIKIKRGIGYFVDVDSYQKAMQFKKNEFLTEELPNIFKSMELLDIGFEDFKNLYHQRGKYEKK